MTNMLSMINMITMLNMLNIINMLNMLTMTSVINMTRMIIVTKQSMCDNSLLITMWCDDPKSSDHHLTKIHMTKGHHTL